jgi:hypothetical protein
MCALTATVSATAFGASPTLLNSTGEQSLLLITGLSTVASELQKLGGSKIICPEVHFRFHQEPNSNLGTFHFDFLKCEEPTLKAKCTGLGEATAGEILVLGTYHLVYDGLSPLGSAALMLINEVHFACSIVLLKVKGEVLCLVSMAAMKSSKLKLECTQTGGDPGEVKYWKTSEGAVTEIPNGLLASESDGEFKDAGEKASGEGTITNDTGAVEEAELMA